ncbi:unnamed protein product [Clavelina lepadiformis]|uniref:Sulfotransferase n=1 Tax=Clavelina lepadiformis TaxID=159417 RepID=A0ABP0GP88_CLALP
MSLFNDFEDLRSTVNVIPEDKRPDAEVYINFQKSTFLENPIQKSWKDYLLYPGFEPETAQFANEEWNPRKNDVIVATFVRAGMSCRRTTWTRELLGNIIYLNEEENLEKSKYFHYFYAYLEFGPRKQSMFAKEGEGYLEHIRSWYQHKDDENVLFLCFEEMKRDLQKQVRRLADFIEVSLTDDDVKKVCENSSIGHMKNSWKSSEMPATFFLRKGQVGDWKNHLTVAQSEKIDANVERVLGDTDIKFIYELDQ